MREYFAGGFFTLSMYLASIQQLMPAFVSLILGGMIWAHKKHRTKNLINQNNNHKTID